MSEKSINNLSSMHLDILKEVGNIGSGNAATSLSGMISSSVLMGVPEVKTLYYNNVVNMLGGAENIVVGLLIRFSGDINGVMMYILSFQFASEIINEIYGKELKSIDEFNEMDISTISELCNIMGGSYLNAISQMTGLTIKPSVPSFCADMVGAIMSAPLVEFESIGDKVIFIDDNFRIKGADLQSNMIVIPDNNSLKLLFRSLGAEI